MSNGAPPSANIVMTPAAPVDLFYFQPLPPISPPVTLLPAMKFNHKTNSMYLGGP
jgi:hypothetical protein